MINNKIYIFGG
jgi:hypothetical protein